MKNLKLQPQPRWSRRAACLLAGLALPLVSFTSQAQIDPAPRQLLHLGADASLTDQGPMGAYAFYYWNMVNVPTTNQNLRLVIAPGYVDSELGFKKLLGEHTDLAVGAFGGLFYNNYQEVDHGQWYKNQSFDGNGGGGSVSMYHLFNPDQHIPLSGVLRVKLNYNTFDKTDDTATGKDNPGNPFVLPQNQSIITYRAGFRWGGKEPMLGPILGMEISGWYEADQRTSPGGYGFGNDRELEKVTQRYFARAQLNYTTLESKHYIVFGLQGGGMINADRIGAYRLGGVLPYTSEFPRPIPGYFASELSAENFGMAYGAYTIPFGSQNQWSIIGMGSVALVDYVEGTGQSGAFNSGVGVGPGYSAPSGRWKIMSLASYGINAQRQDGRGGYAFGMAFQYNFGSLQYGAMKAFEKLEEMNAGVTR